MYAVKAVVEEELDVSDIVKVPAPMFPPWPGWESQPLKPVGYASAPHSNKKTDNAHLVID